MTYAPLPKYIDVLVIGAGPAGIGSALAFRRKGYSVLMIEKETDSGRYRRGETIRFNQEMEDLLYPGFFEQNTIHRINQRRYYSHSGKKFTDRTISTWNLIISWPQIINSLHEFIQNQGVILSKGTEAVSLIQKDGVVSGAICEHAGKTHEIQAQVVVLASGHKLLNVPGNGTDRSLLDIPIYKKLVKNYLGQDNMLTYFFHVDETWPAIGAIFPRGNQEAEVLIMFMTDSAKRPPKPDNDDKAKAIINTFHILHPVFGEYLQGAETYYETFTKIPMGNIGNRVVPLKGTLSAGDAVGHVEARGGSGIRSSFMMAYTTAESASETVVPEYFSDSSVENLQNMISGCAQMRELRDLNLKFGIPRRLFFNTVTDPGAMDVFWFGLEFFMR